MKRTIVLILGLVISTVTFSQEQESQTILQDSTTLVASDSTTLEMDLMNLDSVTACSTLESANNSTDEHKTEDTAKVKDEADMPKRTDANKSKNRKTDESRNRKTNKKEDVFEIMIDSLNEANGNLTRQLDSIQTDYAQFKKDILENMLKADSCDLLRPYKQMDTVQLKNMSSRYDGLAIIVADAKVDSIQERIVKTIEVKVTVDECMDLTKEEFSGDEAFVTLLTKLKEYIQNPGAYYLSDEQKQELIDIAKDLYCYLTALDNFKIMVAKINTIRTTSVNRGMLLDDICRLYSQPLKTSSKNTLIDIINKYIRRSPYWDNVYVEFNLGLFDNPSKVQEIEGKVKTFKVDWNSVNSIVKEILQYEKK